MKQNNFEKIYTKNYKEIVRNIHKPKVDFLKKVVNKKLNLLDFGTGAGHFVRACLNKKINAWGIEENDNLVRFGNKKVRGRILQSKSTNLEHIIKKYKINCLSLIFVLEHLKDPNYIFKIFRQTEVEYLYLALPMASLVIYFENILEEVFPRQLGGTHTHLFTNESINYIKKKYKLKILGEWWFGTDFADLYRSTKIYLKIKTIKMILLINLIKSFYLKLMTFNQF